MEQSRHQRESELRRAREIDALFFSPHDYIQRGTPEHRDFHAFLQKYVARAAKQPSKATGYGDAAVCAQLGIPSGAFNRRYRLNFSILGDHKKRRQKMLDNEQRTMLTEQEIDQIRTAMHLYEDFLQKKKVDQLHQIQRIRQQLPIATFADEVVAAVRKHPVVIVAGDTGCGKSTQVPQFLMAAGFEHIGCTQPRRISAVSLCRRVGYETLNEFGSEVGYQIRFDSNVTRHTKIVFLTEGLVLRQALENPELTQYDVLIVDEAHERHTSTDLLLSYIKRLLQIRPSMRLVLMSATANIELFGRFFGSELPIIKVPGRMYPVGTEYRESDCDDSKQSISEKISTGYGDPLRKRKRLKIHEPGTWRPYIQVLQSIDKRFPATERGDLLVFLSGANEINALTEEVRRYCEKNKRWVVLPLHSGLPVEEQDRVFDLAPDGKRKCVISTNIAETSLTIDGIRFVIDSGHCKEMAWDPVTRIQSLQEFWISRASAMQRQGRAGRTGPGVCYRMYSEAEFRRLAQFSPAEICSTPLEGIVLQMIALGMGDPSQVQLPEAPPAATLESAITALTRHGCIGKNYELTPLGELLSSLPTEVHLGKLLVLGGLLRVDDAALTLAAALAVQSPFKASDQFRGGDEGRSQDQFDSLKGDPFTLLDVFEAWSELKDRRGSDSRKWCFRHGLNESRLYEMAKLRKQFSRILADVQLAPATLGPEPQRDPEHGKASRELRQLQREQERKRGRQRIKLDENDEVLVDRSKPDLRSMEYDLKFTSGATTRNRAESELIVLSAVIGFGLYPQIAIPDEANAAKDESEAVFHTASRSQVPLHPSSALFRSPVRFHPKREILLYGSLLETNKTFIVNVCRSPALALLLWCSHEVDCTSKQCNRLLFDQRHLVQLKDASDCTLLLATAARARQLLAQLLATTLQAPSPPIPPTPPPGVLPTGLQDIVEEQRAGCGGSSEDLRVLLVELYDLEHETEYTLTIATEGEIQERANQKQRGVQVTSWLWYEPQLPPQAAWASRGFSAHMKTKYLCPICTKEFRFNITEVAGHHTSCSTKPPAAPAEAAMLQLDNDLAAGLPMDDGMETCREPTGNSNNAQTGQKRKLDSLEALEQQCVEQQHVEQRATPNPNERQPFECPKCAKTFMFMRQQAENHIKRCST